MFFLLINLHLCGNFFHSLVLIIACTNFISQKQVNAAGDFKMCIYNVEGKCVERNILHGKTIEIPFKNYLSGIYFLKIESKDDAMTVKFFKE